jgi:NitT/TauT family transport system substrate-binding protein
MKIRFTVISCSWAVAFLVQWFVPNGGFAMEKLLGIHSARTVSQSMPWIAQEVGLFRKYDLDFQLVYISSSSMVTAAMLSGDGEVALSGGEAFIRAYAQGAADFVFIASAKNTLTHSILAKPEVKTVEELRAKKIGVPRLGSNSHYFVIQALRQKGLEPRNVN